MQRDLKSLGEVEHQIFDGDLLLFRRRSLISVYGRGEYSHAAMAGQFEAIVCCLEQREFCGARLVTLASQVAKRPGRIDVFRPQVPLAARGVALRAMLSKMGAPYSYRSVLQSAALHLPFFRLLKQPMEDLYTPLKFDPPRAEHCAQAFSSAWRAAGYDPVPRLPDWASEPCDLARSERFAGRYQFTLIP